MLARSILLPSPAHQQPCTAVTSLPRHARLLVVPRAKPPSRSSSSRNESWRSNWRTELDSSSSSGNGNGAHTHLEGSELRSLYDSRAPTHDHDYHQDAWSLPTGVSEQQQQPHGYQQQRIKEDESYYYDSEGALRYDRGSDTAAAARHQQEEEGVRPEEQEDAESSASGSTVGDTTGLFTDAFKEALKAALERSPLYGNAFGGEGSGGEEDVEPQPYEANEARTLDQPIFTDQFRAVLKESMARQQAEMDAISGYGSDDDYTPVPYVPSPPARREMSPIEEVIASALGASRFHLRRLNLIRNEIEAAIERESKQVERLDFALNKAQADVAYYKTLERMMEEGKQ